MGYSVVGRKDKALELHPEIERHGLSAKLVFDTAEDRQVVTMRRDGHQFTPNPERADADDCVDGIAGVSLGIQVEQFVKSFEQRR